MRLYFIRHGQSENNALYQNTGSDYDRVEDPKLTTAGWEQASRTAAWLSTHNDPVDDADGDCFGITHLYTSLMYRSLGTSSVIGEKLGLQPVAWKDWHENGGIYLEDRSKKEFLIRPGMTAAEIRATFPGVILDESVTPAGWWNRPVEGADERPVRARRAFRELLRRHGDTDDRVAVVSHGGFFMHFLAAVLGIDEITPVWFRLYNCGIARFDFIGDDRVVVYHNFTEHLGRGLIT